jgi:hypothetical protein
MAQIRWAREPWPLGGCVQNFPRIKNFGRLKCSKKTSYPPNHVVVSDLFHFPSPPPSGGGFRASSPIYGVFYSLALWPIFSMTSCINFSKWPAVSRRSPRCELRASRAAAVLPSLLPNLPLRPPTLSHLALSLWLPRRLPRPCCHVRPSVLPLKYPLIPLYRGRLLVVFFLFVLLLITYLLVISN